MTTYYVDETNGTDTDDGSEANPWKTNTGANGVNSKSLSAGDSVLYKRGETWTNDRLQINWDGSDGSPITFGAYGSGAKPIFVNTSTGWVGITDYYAAGTSSWIILEYLEVKDWDDTSAGYGLYFDQTANMIVRYCDLHDNRNTGAFLTNGDGLKAYGNTAYGNTNNTGIWIDNCDNADVYKNTCYSNGQDGITIKSLSGAKVYRNIAYNNSLISSSYGGIGIERAVSTSKLYYNICYDNQHAGIVNNSPGNEIYNNVCFENNLYGLLFVDWAGSAPENCIVKNNIFYQIDNANALCVAIFDAGDTAYTGKNNTFDYNYYFSQDGTPATDSIAGDQTESPDEYYTFAQWQTEGMEANGALDDPEFLDTANDDYHLKTSSPCIEAGTPIADTDLVIDYDGIPLGRGTNPDIGAFETLKGGPRRL